MINLIKLKTTDSTNNYAKALLKSGEPLKPYTVIFAHEQTCGKGRLGRVWHSKKDETLCMSLIVPDFSSPCITLLCALGVHRALKPLCDTPLMIKWPNDIIADNKKLCGILTEGALGNAVVGIGINLNTTYFPEDIAHKATSLKILTNQNFDPVSLCETVAKEVFEVLETHGGILDSVALAEYTSLCANIGMQIGFSSKKGTAVSVDNSGALVVATDEGEIKVTHGEVTVTDIY